MITCSAPWARLAKCWTSGILQEPPAITACGSTRVLCSPATLSSRSKAVSIHTLSTFSASTLKGSPITHRSLVDGRRQPELTPVTFHAYVRDSTATHLTQLRIIQVLNHDTRRYTAITHWHVSSVLSFQRLLRPEMAAAASTSQCCMRSARVAAASSPSCRRHAPSPSPCRRPIAARLLWAARSVNA
jgi:hypothetical protein